MRELSLLAAKCDLPAQAVDRLVASDIDQPCPRIGRRIGGGPALQRHRECILQRVLGEIEVADQTDQRRQRPARLAAEGFFDFSGCHKGAPKITVIPERPKDEPGIHNHDREYGFRACACRRIPE